MKDAISFPGLLMGALTALAVGVLAGRSVFFRPLLLVAAGVVILAGLGVRRQAVAPAFIRNRGRNKGA